MLPATLSLLAHLAPSSNGTGTMMLLSDGTVMVQGGGSGAAVKTWFKLTPDSSGSYVDGTWTQMPSMHLERLYYGSNVLPDGRVFIVGGEYSGPNTTQNFTNTGEIFDPVANQWTNITNFPQARFGDDPTELLPDGTVLAGYVSGPQTYTYNPATNTWTLAATKLLNDQSDEETWVKLPDDSILTYDVFNNGHAQRYVPSQNQWVDAGTVPVSLSGSNVGSELGPAFRLQDGRIFVIGATRNTALYDPATNSWTAGPTMPSGIGADDAPGVELPNGHIAFAADHPLFHSPTNIFDFDPATGNLTQLTVPARVGLSSRPAYVTRSLMLPSGQVLFTNSTDQLFVYTPDGGADPSLAPTIAGITDNGDGTFTLTGTQLNGISEGACYGDDAEMSSNYPLVRLTDANGNVSYARTFNWSSTGVATGDTPVSTQFTLPAGLAPGDYSLVVVANGIASDPVDFMVTSAPAGAHVLRASNPDPAVFAGQDGQLTSTFIPPVAFTAGTNTLAIGTAQSGSDLGSTVALDAGDRVTSLSAASALAGLAAANQPSASVGVPAAIDLGLSELSHVRAAVTPADGTLDGFFAGDPFGQVG
jgi:hypothetical protein